MSTKWSLQEDNFLRLNYKQQGLERILGRTSEDISNRINYLKLGKTYRGISTDGFQVGGAEVRGSGGVDGSGKGVDSKGSKSKGSKSKTPNTQPQQGTARTWDKASDSYLRRYFPVKPITSLANHFNITQRQVRHRANYLGLLRAETLGFKPIDLNYILENYPTKSIDELSALTGYHQAHIRNALTILQNPNTRYKRGL